MAREKGGAGLLPLDLSRYRRAIAMLAFEAHLLANQQGNFGDFGDRSEGIGAPSSLGDFGTFGGANHTHWRWRPVFTKNLASFSFRDNRFGFGLFSLIEGCISIQRTTCFVLWCFFRTDAAFIISFLLQKEKNIELNRKTLAHMAVHDPAGFAEVVNSVK